MHIYRGSRFANGMNTTAWRLLALCLAASAITFVVQYALDRRLDVYILTYLLPACIVAYLSGRRDALAEKARSRTEGAAPNEKR